LFSFSPHLSIISLSFFTPLPPDGFGFFLRPSHLGKRGGGYAVGNRKRRWRVNPAFKVYENFFPQESQFYCDVLIWLHKYNINSSAELEFRDNCCGRTVPDLSEYERRIGELVFFLGFLPVPWTFAGKTQKTRINLWLIWNLRQV
jgi:hypothetical protein